MSSEERRPIHVSHIHDLYIQQRGAILRSPRALKNGQISYAQEHQFSFAVPFAYLSASTQLPILHLKARRGETEVP